jgi:hypothetical protein
MDRRTGSCLCGDVRIVASGFPYRVGLCHCLDCRKHHGALFSASAVFPQDAVTIDGETRDYAGRSFCPRCGSSVFARTADEIEVHLGSLDAPDQLSRAFEAGATVATLNVYRDNAAAAALYARLGFARAEQPSGESPSHDTWFMQRSLGPVEPGVGPSVSAT